MINDQVYLILCVESINAIQNEEKMQSLIKSVTEM